MSLVVLTSGWQRDLSAEAAAAVRVQLAASFVKVHAGYRLREMLAEACDSQAIEHARSTGVFHLVSTFDDFHAQHPGNRWNRDRALFIVTRAEAMAATGSIAGIAFTHKDPVFGLRPAEQSLLAAALEGLTDEELAAKLALKLTTIKKRWASIFDRIVVVRPDLFPVADASAQERLSRGRQKRHRVLAYLREHPEELRPVESSSALPSGESAATRRRI
jgi:hypothetical protein